MKTELSLNNNLIALSIDDEIEVNGGFITTLVAIGVVCGAAVAIFEAGKIVGDCIGKAVK